MLDFNIELISHIKHVANHVFDPKLFTDALPQDILLLPEEKVCCGKVCAVEYIFNEVSIKPIIFSIRLLEPMIGRTLNAHVSNIYMYIYVFMAVVTL